MNTCGAVMLPDTAPSTLPRTLFSSGTSMYSKPLSDSSCLALAQCEQPIFENTTTWSGLFAFGAMWFSIVSASETLNGSPGSSGSINILVTTPSLTSIE
ncbi:hypothetical protein D3C87_1634280 [compost metagenome]